MRAPHTLHQLACRLLTADHTQAPVSGTTTQRLHLICTATESRGSRKHLCINYHGSSYQARFKQDQNQQHCNTVSTLQRLQAISYCICGTYLHSLATVANDEQVAIRALVQVAVHEALQPKVAVVLALSLWLAVCSTGQVQPHHTNALCYGLCGNN